MLMLLFKLLIHYGISLPSALFDFSTRMLLGALTAWLIMMLLSPWWIKKLYEIKTGQTLRVEEDCPLLVKLYEKKKNTPSMGGFLILFSMVMALLLWMDLSSSYTWILLITTLWLGGVGAYDDYLKLKHKNSKGLSSAKKMGLQLIFAACIAGYSLIPGISSMVEEKVGFKAPIAKDFFTESQDSPIVYPQTEFMTHYYIPFYKYPVFKTVTGISLIAAVMIIVVITGTSNAVNLTDGLDGLASGCVVLVAGVLGIVAFLSNHAEIAKYLHILYIEGAGEIAIFLFATVGACLGFLWYNGHPAQVFMGDTGSLALGGVLGVSAVLLRCEPLLALVGGVFVIETLSVILQVTSYKWRNQKRVFLCTPLHHHFEYKGWPETKIVLRFWIIGLILAVIGLISLKVH
ncbi:MAG: phospho-N-acetylmuramoyl-pentapeptide-transferase [Candidatus Rhabdochlamydia sp.]